MNTYICTHCGAAIERHDPPEDWHEFLCGPCKDEGWAWENETDDSAYNDPRRGQAAWINSQR